MLSAAILATYLVLRAIMPLRLSWLARAGLALAIYGVALHQRIVPLFAGSWASPELPKLVIALLNIGFVALLMTATCVLLLDIAALLLGKLGCPRVAAALRGPRLWSGVAALASLLSIYGTWQAMAVPQVRQVDIAISGLPPAFDGYRVLHLTDTHASRLLTGSWVAQVVAESNAQRADLVVITGDIVDGSTTARADDVRPLADLHAPDGVIAITGNHEYYGEYGDWMNAFRAMGMQVLENTHTQVRRDGATLTIAGVTDPAAARFDLPIPNIDAALAGADPHAPIILLDHRPGEARESAKRGVVLQLSGHTHGGHIVGLDRLVAMQNGGFVSGLYEVGGMQLYVSNGAGLWPGFASRIGVPSEITLIVLRRAGA